MSIFLWITSDLVGGEGPSVFIQASLFVVVLFSSLKCHKDVGVEFLVVHFKVLWQFLIVSTDAGGPRGVRRGGGV